MAASATTTAEKSGIVIVTGGSRGIGAGIVAALVRSGYRVASLSRSGDMPALADGTRADRVHAFACDVTDPSSVQQAFAQVAAVSQPVVGLVNNAGLHLHGPSDRFSMSDYATVMDTNARAVLLASQQAYPLLCAAGGGLIVNIGSIFDKMGVKHNLAYCASKAAVGAMTRCLAVEWASKAIRVVDVAPGYIVTDLNRDALQTGPLRAYLDKRIPCGAPGKVEDVAGVVAMLFEHGCSFLTGETIYVDGAQGIAH